MNGDSNHLLPNRSIAQEGVFACDLHEVAVGDG